MHFNHSMVNGVASIEIVFDDRDSASVKRNCVEIVQALKLHCDKARDYAGAEDELGPKAQFVDMNRKWVKVKRALWDEKPLTGEPLEEVLQDMVGHIGITLRQLSQGSHG